MKYSSFIITKQLLLFDIYTPASIVILLMPHSQGPLFFLYLSSLSSTLGLGRIPVEAISILVIRNNMNLGIPEIEKRMDNCMKKHLLLIDEDLNEMVSFMEILKNIKDSFKCTYAQSGRQAIEKLQHTTPDYIFIDYELSEMNALQVVSAIRFKSKLKESKVYLYSDYFSDDTSKMARMLGAAGCIEKSGEFSGLVHKFKAIFSPELLPSYVFLKNNQPAQFFCYNAPFLNAFDDNDKTIRQLCFQKDNLYGSPDGNELDGVIKKSVEINSVRPETVSSR